MVDIVRYARPQDYTDKIVIIMVETPAAIDRIDEIAAVPGIDVINIGVNDVAHAMGFPGQPEHPAVTAALEKAIARVVKGGKTAGLNVLANWEERMPWLLKRRGRKHSKHRKSAGPLRALVCASGSDENSVLPVPFS